MTELEGKIRCLELAEKIQVKIGDKHLQTILDTYKTLWQGINECEKSVIETPAAEGEPGKKSRGRKRKELGEPDPLS